MGLAIEQAVDEERLDEVNQLLDARAELLNAYQRSGVTLNGPQVGELGAIDARIERKLRSAQRELANQMRWQVNAARGTRAYGRAA